MKQLYRDCPKCGTENHVRRILCINCQTEFPKKIKVEREEKGEKGERKCFRLPDGLDYVERFTVIKTPAGPCPLPLKSNSEAIFPDDDVILEWALDLREHMLAQGQYLINQALIYWARQQLNGNLQYSPVGDEMQYLKLIIGNLPDIIETSIAA